jgi:hypothetical protein
MAEVSRGAAGGVGDLRPRGVGQAELDGLVVGEVPALATYDGVCVGVERVQALSATEAESPPTGRPHDPRHVAVSTWLNAGVPSAQVAEWAGHSLAVLLQIYAKCFVGQEEAARRRIAGALGEG